MAADSTRTHTAPTNRQQQTNPAATAGGAHSQTGRTDPNPANFEYDDNEWDVGIGDLIIDLDADIEKTNEAPQSGAIATPGGSNPAGAGKAAHSGPAKAMAANAQTPAGKSPAAKLAVEHSATVDKGLKMKIKRTKPGTKTSEAKHEIVKSNEQQNGTDSAPATLQQLPLPQPGGAANATTMTTTGTGVKHTQAAQVSAPKRGSSGHRRDKARGDKRDSLQGQGQGQGQGGNSNGEKQVQQQPVQQQQGGKVQQVVAEVNGLVRVGGAQGRVFPASTGPGPPPTVSQQGPVAPPAPSPAPVPVAAVKVEPKCAQSDEARGASPPPAKKLKTEPKVSAAALDCAFVQISSRLDTAHYGPFIEITHA